MLEQYWRGDWDEALATADDFVAQSEAGSAHYMEAPCRRVRGAIYLARGDVEAAVAEAERSVDFARRARDPWFFHPSLSFRARALLAGGRPAEASEAVDELLGTWRGASRTIVVSFEVVDAALVLAALGRGSELAAATERVETPTRWLVAAHALVRGDAAAAADLFAEIGSRPDEAYARLAAARVGNGSVNGQLDRALAFFREVGADAYAREAEGLVAATG